MPRVTFVKKARKDIPGTGIKAGESYYWWKFRYGGKRYSKTYPKQSELTQSSFLSQLYDLQDRLSDAGSLSSQEELESFRDDLVSDIESLKDECQSHLDNMPEHLQESSSSGELLNERISALEEWISELENVDIDIDEDHLRSEAEDEIWDERDTASDSDEEEEPDREEYLQEKYQEVTDRLEEKISDAISEIVSNLQDCQPSL